MSKIAKWIVPLVAVVLLTACSGDSGGDVSSLRKGGNDAPQTEMQAPTVAPAPQVQRVEVTRETVRDVPVEVTRIVEVQVTPAPDIQNFNAPQCDGSTVVMTPDPNEAAQGVVAKGGLNDCRVQELRAQGVMP